MSERIFAVAHLADKGVLLLLVALGLASAVIIVERWRFLSKLVAASAKHRKHLQEAWQSRNWKAIENVAADGDSLEGQASAYALDHIQRHGTAGIKEAFEAISLVEKPKLERSLAFLATVGSNAPYIGLFGTVLGIMKAFNDLSKATDAGQQGVMGGISSALIATAAGLMVAIPAVLAFNYFQKQVKMILTGLETCREVILVWAMQGGGKSGGTGN